MERNVDLHGLVVEVRDLAAARRFETSERRGRGLSGAAREPSAAAEKTRAPRRWPPNRRAAAQAPAAFDA